MYKMEEKNNQNQLPQTKEQQQQQVYLSDYVNRLIKRSELNTKQKFREEFLAP